MAFMRSAGRTILSLAVLLPAVASAYYDDVHYGLTYYVARQTGFTPEQAYRIASACSAVDWDERTEPVQLGGQLMALLTPLSGGIHGPRSKFHAFRNESDSLRRVLGNEPDARAAQQEVYDQLAGLKSFCTETTKNLGVYLHGFQDVYPHFGWGTYWGHNPADYATFQRAVAQGMHPGSSTDWVDFRQQHVLALCGWTNAELIPFMNAISPHQYARPHYQHEFVNVVVGLAKANPFPEPLDTDLDRMTFLYVGLKDKGAPADTILRAVNSKENVDKIVEYLKNPAIQLKMQKHLKGPNVEDGYKVIDQALADAGMADRLPPHHIPYQLSSEGGPTNPAQLDDWVLVGDATLTTKGYRSVSATLHMDVRDASGTAKRTALYGIDPVSIRAGGNHTWRNLPIGEIYALLKPEEGNDMFVRLALSRRKNAFTVDVGGTPPPNPVPLPAPTEPKPTTPSEPVPKGMANFNGTWFSSVGRFGYPHNPLIMSQSANQVTGTFKHRSGSGTVKGTVKGLTLTFTYTYTSENFSETGKGTFTMKSDNKSFSGTYSSDLKDGIKNNGWRGHKTSD